ncbi:MAG: hypothetical protein MI924_22650 [Chloroflexales bacterium]|nr:hypothetical protein [Chloroflexales bacterium]
MSDEQNVQQLLEYLRQNHPQYELELLCQHLITSGHNPVNVATALERYKGETKPILPNPPDLVSSEAMKKASVDATIVLPGALVDIEASTQRALAYLFRHRGQHDLQVLRQHLIASGQPSPAVDEAIHRLGTSKSFPQTIPLWAFGGLIALGNGVMLPASLGTLAVVLLSLGVGTGLTLVLILGGVVLLLLTEFVVSIVLLTSANRQAGKAILFGLLFTVIPLLLLGFVFEIYIAVSRL